MVHNLPSVSLRQFLYQHGDFSRRRSQWPGGNGSQRALLDDVLRKDILFGWFRSSQIPTNFKTEPELIAMDCIWSTADQPLNLALRECCWIH